MTANASNTTNTRGAAGGRAPDFSVVVPCFNEDATIREFHERLVAALKPCAASFELIYVNDGSADETLELLYQIHDEQDMPTCVVDLVQNVGQTNAMTAGLQHATGEHIIFLDCDLQVAPEDVCRLIEVFDERYDMVGGKRVQRKDGFVRILISLFGNAFIRRTLGLPLRDFGSGLKIVNGAFVRAFEPGPFRPINPGAMMLSLRRIKEVPIAHYPRKSGGSRWTIKRFFALYHNIFRHLVPFIYPFTVTPMLLLALALIVYFVLAALYPDTFPYTDRPAVVPMLVAFSIALSLVNLLLLGEFVLRGSSYAQEPAYIVRRVLPAKEQPPGACDNDLVGA